jgi:alkylation response protein AidB-like acyl-CoA dehydrogenase
MERASKVAREVLAIHAALADSSGSWPAQSVEALGREGLLGLTVSPELGGAGQGPVAFAGVTRLLAEQCASTAMIYVMHTCGIQVISAAHAFASRNEVLRAAACGRHLTTLAFSERGSRSHFWAPVSQAIRGPEGDLLSAQKSWVTSAGHADSYIVSSRTAASMEPLASTLYFVSRGAQGLETAGAWNGLGLRANASAPMRLERVCVSDSERVSEDGQGFATMINTVLPWFQLGSAAVSVGISRAATDAVRQHLLATKLEHLGQTLASLPNLRSRLAQMQIAVDTQQAFCEHVAGQIEARDTSPMLAVLQSKAAAAEAALFVTDLAMRTCGGAAFSRESSVERHFRDARAAWVMAPTTDVLHDFIGRRLLGMPLF